MLNIGLMEWIFLFIIVLLVIGPEQLPQMTQMILRTINELKRAINSIKIHDFTKDFNKNTSNTNTKPSIKKNLPPHFKITKE